RLAEGDDLLIDAGRRSASGRSSALVSRPGRARGIDSGNVEIISSSGAQAGDRAAGAGAAQAGHLLPGAVDPLIDKVTTGTGHAVPGEVDLRSRERRGLKRRGGW